MDCLFLSTGYNCFDFFLSRLNTTVCLQQKAYVNGFFSKIFPGNPLNIIIGYSTNFFQVIVFSGIPGHHLK